ncbi:hypothetical protein LJC72_12135 [Bacteroides sp. OttesenSCG-928-D19]|nr:hypothetical protein [Bacteroides sp. OttesenSCG-928-N06]MDL2306066.1 hypothetical protein [Bacteroides sp. OttesenSCG-928-D19]
MTTLELEARKAYIIRLIINVDSEEIINKLSQTVEKFVSPSLPCQHSMEELKKGLPEFYSASEKGELTSHEDVKRMFA